MKSVVVVDVDVAESGCECPLTPGSNGKRFKSVERTVELVELECGGEQRPLWRYGAAAAGVNQRPDRC